MPREIAFWRIGWLRWNGFLISFSQDYYYFSFSLKNVLLFSYSIRFIPESIVPLDASGSDRINPNFESLLWFNDAYGRRIAIFYIFFITWNAMNSVERKIERYQLTDNQKLETFLANSQSIRVYSKWWSKKSYFT